MYFHSRYIEYKNLIQVILIPLLSSVVFTCTEKGQRFSEIYKTVKLSCCDDSAEKIVTV